MTREPFIAHSELTNEIYIVQGQNKYRVTEQVIHAVKAIKALEQEPCEDVISRKSIKQKLQEHHDFFVNAYGGFSNLPQNEKSRVDEITNCIAMVVNEPPVISQELFINKPCVSGGVCEHDKNKVLDKLRAEIKALSPEPTAYDVIDGNPVKDAVWETLIEVDKIFDKYKAESEEI